MLIKNVELPCPVCQNDISLPDMELREIEFDEPIQCCGIDWKLTFESAYNGGTKELGESAEMTLNVDVKLEKWQD